MATASVQHEDERASLAGPPVVYAPPRRWWPLEKVLPLVLEAPETQPALRDNIVSVFMPGFSAARAQASQYTGPDPVTVLDRHDNSRVLYRATSACAPRLLHNVIPQPEVHDIEHIRSKPAALQILPPKHFGGVGDERARDLALAEGDLDGVSED